MSQGSQVRALMAENQRLKQELAEAKKGSTKPVAKAKTSSTADKKE